MDLKDNLEELRTHAYYLRTFISLLLLFTVFAIYYLTVEVNTFLFLIGSATILIFIHLTKCVFGTKIVYRTLCLYLLIIFMQHILLQINHY